MNIIQLTKKGLPYGIFLLKKLYWCYKLNRHNNFNCKGRLLNSSISMRGVNNSIDIATGVELRNTTIIIKGNNNTIKIKNNTRFTEGGKIRIEDDSNSLTIGQNCIFSDAFFSIADRTKIEIGNECLISSNVIFRTTDSHSIIDVNTNQRINPGKDIIVGNHCWVGYGVTILKGTKIYSDCIIGNGSIVAGSTILTGSIAVGIPVKIIKNNITWRYERI